MLWGIKGGKILERVGECFTWMARVICLRRQQQYRKVPLHWISWFCSQRATLLNSLILALYHCFFLARIFPSLSLLPHRTSSQNTSCVCLFISCSRRKPSTLFPPWPCTNMSQGCCFVCRCKQMFNSVTGVLEPCNWFASSCGNVIHDSLSLFLSYSSKCIRAEAAS